ncbi:hypothetical protein D3C76_683060 [compost metagenome]
MLLVTAVIEADFVVRRRPQDVTFVIANSDMVTVRRVVKYTGDVRSVRVTVLKANRHFGARQQRQVQAVSVSRIRAGLTHPQALEPGLPVITVKQHVDAIAAVFIDMSVGVIFGGTGDAGW